MVSPGVYQNLPVQGRIGLHHFPEVPFNPYNYLAFIELTLTMFSEAVEVVSQKLTVLGHSACLLMGKKYVENLKRIIGQQYFVSSILAILKGFLCGLYNSTWQDFICSKF